VYNTLLAAATAGRIDTIPERHHYKNPNELLSVSAIVFTLTYMFEMLSANLDIATPYEYILF
jgi:hypothetical protein